MSVLFGSLIPTSVQFLYIVFIHVLLYFLDFSNLIREKLINECFQCLAILDVPQGRCKELRYFRSVQTKEENGSVVYQSQFKTTNSILLNLTLVKQYRYKTDFRNYNYRTVITYLSVQYIWRLEIVPFHMHADAFNTLLDCHLVAQKIFHSTKHH